MQGTRRPPHTGAESSPLAELILKASKLRGTLSAGNKVLNPIQKRLSQAHSMPSPKLRKSGEGRVSRQRKVTSVPEAEVSSAEHCEEGEISVLPNTHHFADLLDVSQTPYILSKPCKLHDCYYHPTTHICETTGRNANSILV